MVNACKTGDPCLLQEPGRSPGEGNGSLLQYFCLSKAPKTEEPGGSQSLWPQEPDVTEHLTLTFMYLEGVINSIQVKKWGFPGSSVGRASAVQAGSIPGLGLIP